MTIDLAMLYVTGSVLVTTSVVYLLHVVGSAIGRSMFAGSSTRV